MTEAGRIADAALEASVVGSFSRIGLRVRSRLLPEFRDGPAALSGRTVLITGATSGMGLAVASSLAGRGAAIHFLARGRERAERARRRIAAAAGSDGVSYGLADLTNLDSVRGFAAATLAALPRIDVLIHNAGAIHPGYEVSADGLELTFAGQVAGPFTLTRLLLPALISAGPARVITVSSGGMYAQ